MEDQGRFNGSDGLAQVGWLAGLAGCTAITAESARATRLPLTLQLPLAGAARGNKGEKRMEFRIKKPILAAKPRQQIQQGIGYF